MVVDNPAGLQVGIDCNCAYKFEAAFLQIFTDSVGEPVADRNRSSIMPLIQDCLPIGIRPNISAKAPVFLTHLLIAPGIVDYSLNFAPG